MDDIPTQDATDRFRARVAATPISTGGRRDRSVAPWVIVALLFVFALGLIANPWFEHSVRSRLPGFDAPVDADPAAVAALRTQVAALDARLRAVEARPAQVAAAPGGVANERVAAVEARLDALERAGNATTARIDTLTSGVAALTGRVDATAGQTVLTLQAARTDADRAQGALAVLAARRAIEGGRADPALATPLRALFGQRASPAVEAVVAATTAPVTPPMLRAGLARLRAGTTAAPSGWWEELTGGLAGIITVRDRGAAGGDAIAQADAALAAGDVTRAMAVIERQPASAARDAWLAAARRLRAAQAGLGALEDAAIVARPALP